jgi:hypothetical protein
MLDCAIQRLMNSMNTPTQAPTHRALFASLLFVLLFVAAWLPRVVQLDAFVTPDERRWLQRSANFSYALQEGDFVSTYQTGHPGVTVMWAGVLGLRSTFPAAIEQMTRPLDEESFDA